MTPAEHLIDRLTRIGGGIIHSGGKMQIRIPDTPEGGRLMAELRRNRDAVAHELRSTGPERWRRDFEYWLPERCRFVDGYWSPVEDLRGDFIGWGGVTRDCSQEDFEALIEVEVYIETHGSIRWCYGLVLAYLLTTEMAEARRPRC